MPAADAATPLPRHRFPVTDEVVYLDHAGVAPLPLDAVEAGRAFLDDFARRGGVALPEWEERMEGVRADAAGLLGVPATDVAFVKNTTEGLAFVAGGLEWRAGDRVVVPDREFPSTLFPWLGLADRGVEVSVVEPRGDAWALPLDAFADALAAAPTRLVCVSWVQFARGWRTDLAGLADLCHDHGALLCVDAIQGLGVLPADLAGWGVDFAAADAHKWMLGPLGAGVLYVPERHRDQLRPLEPGWASVAHREVWDDLRLVYDDSARRYEGGSQTIEAIVELGASVRLLLDAGVEQVWAHVDRLLHRAAEGIAGLGGRVVSDRDAGRSAHLTFVVPDHDPELVHAGLAERGIVCSPRGGGVRIAPHGYNDDTDIDRFLEALAVTLGLA